MASKGQSARDAPEMTLSEESEGEVCVPRRANPCLCIRTSWCSTEIRFMRSHVPQAPKARQEGKFTNEYYNGTDADWNTKLTVKACIEMML